jgi:hypothetical protein
MGDAAAFLSSMSDKTYLSDIRKRTFRRGRGEVNLRGKPSGTAQGDDAHATAKKAKGGTVVGGCRQENRLPPPRLKVPFPRYIKGDDA